VQERAKGLRSPVLRISRRQHQQPPLSLTSNKHEAIFRRGLSLPAFCLKAFDCLLRVNQDGKRDNQDGKFLRGLFSEVLASDLTR
jgi:hypothetical protein